MYVNLFIYLFSQSNEMHNTEYPLPPPKKGMVPQNVEYALSLLGVKMK